MARHYLDGQRRIRRLTEQCQVCTARTGEPCNDGVDGSKPEDYECPDGGCHQLYDNRRDALNCVMHIKE